MNLVEVMYELALQKPAAVKTVITYIEEGPMAGLPIDKLLRILANSKKKTSYNQPYYRYKH